MAIYMTMSASGTMDQPRIAMPMRGFICWFLLVIFLPGATLAAQDSSPANVITAVLVDSKLHQQRDATIAVLPAAGDPQMYSFPRADYSSVLVELAGSELFQAEVLTLDNLTESLPKGQGKVPLIPARYDRHYVNRLVKQFGVTHLVLTDFTQSGHDTTRTTSVLHVAALTVVFSQYHFYAEPRTLSALPTLEDKRLTLDQAQAEIRLLQCVQSLNATSCALELVNRSFSTWQVDQVSIVVNEAVGESLELATFPRHSEPQDQSRLLHPPKVANGERLRLVGTLLHQQSTPIRKTLSLAIDFTGDGIEYRSITDTVEVYTTNNSHI